MANEADLSDQRRPALLKDGKECLWRAVELQASILKDIPRLELAWESLPTIQRLTQRYYCDADQSSIRDLAKLYELMGRFEEAIPLWEYLINMHNSNPTDRI